MARGGTPSGDYKTTVWNFHEERYICPSCKRKGLRQDRNGYYCEYKRFGCNVHYHNSRTEDINLVKQFNPKL